MWADFDHDAIGAGRVTRRESWIRMLGALGEPRFRLLWFGQTVSAFGDRLVPVALVFGVLEATGSATDVGLVLAAGIVPRVAFVLAGGVWADRLPRQLVMLGADVVRGTTQALLAVLLLSDTAGLWSLVLLSAVYGAANAFFRPASTALVPHTVSDERLQQANALMGLSRSGVGILGPAVAGVLVATVGAGWVFVLDAATFAVSVLTLALLRVPAPRPRGAHGTFLLELREGWRELVARQWLWTSILYFTVSNVALGPLFVLGPVVAAESLGGASAWGVISTGSAIGFVLGGVVALRVRPSRPLVTVFLLMAVTAAQPAALALREPALAIAAVSVVATAAVAMTNAVWATTLQERIPANALARVSAYDWLGSLVFLPIGYAIAGPLAAVSSVEAVLWIAAAVTLGSSVAIVAVPAVRRLERHRPAVLASAEAVT